MLSCILLLRCVDLVAGSTCRCCTRRRACLLCRLLPPAFSLLSCPLSPRPPSPAGKGEPQSLFRRGLRPRHPCAEPLAALTEPASAVPGGGVQSALPGGTGYPCPGGEDHLKRRRRVRRIVPSPPVPPLLGCRHCSPVPRPNRHAPAGYLNATSAPPHKRQSPTSGTCLADSISAARVQPRGCKGRSPLHKKTKNLPLPRRGRGAGG